MIQNNKLIAEFMGYTHQSDSAFKDENGFWNDFEVFETWDWLMPVVETCYDNGADENEVGDITHALLDCDIAHTYKAVVEFIKQYNN